MESKEPVHKMDDIEERMKAWNLDINKFQVRQLAKKHIFVYV